MWIKVDEKLPQAIEDDYYGPVYSAPVIGGNEIAGQVYDALLVYDCEARGWCVAGLPEGPDPDDYELPVITHWHEMPTLPIK